MKLKRPPEFLIHRNGNFSYNSIKDNSSYIALDTSKEIELRAGLAEETVLVCR